jgi:hypothetical protein
MSIDPIPSGLIEVPEIPVATQADLPTEKTAVIVVDMQNDFVKPDGNLVVVPADGISSLTAFDQALTLRQVSSLYNGTIVPSASDITFIGGDEKG